MSALRTALGVVLLCAVLPSCNDSTGPGGPNIEGNWSATTPHGVLRMAIDSYTDPSDLRGNYSMGANVDGPFYEGSIAGNQVSLRLGFTYTLGYVTFTGTATSSSMKGVLNGRWEDFIYEEWSYPFNEYSVEFTR